MGISEMKFQIIWDGIQWYLKLNCEGSEQTIGVDRSLEYLVRR